MPEPDQMTMEMEAAATGSAVGSPLIRVRRALEAMVPRMVPQVAILFGVDTETHSHLLGRILHIRELVRARPQPARLTRIIQLTESMEASQSRNRAQVSDKLTKRTAHR